MRTVTLIRHAHSKANEADSSNLTGEGLAFANRSAGLTDEGKLQCQELELLLRTRHGVIPAKTKVAVSTFERTRLTAVELGFVIINPYAQLDEVDPGLPIEKYRRYVEGHHRLPEVSLRAAIAAAEVVLENPPEEEVWISHGLLIAGICSILEIGQQYDRLNPEQCEVREITFKP